MQIQRSPISPPDRGGSRVTSGPEPIARSIARVHLGVAGDARRCGDHAAAEAHEIEAALALRVAAAHDMRAKGARPRPRIDFPAIAAAARPHMLEICRRWLPNGRLVGAEWTCGSLAGEPGDSCRVNIRTGKWADFAAGQSGGDAIALCAAVHRLTQAEAARRLARMLGMEGATDGR
jgi:hypothetical protein